MSLVPLRPLFTYYGSKWSIAGRYPPPRHDLIIEPFAGAASYSLHHYERDVLLRDLDENVVDVWNYLIGADVERILELPAEIPPGTRLDELGDFTPAEKKLVGYWLGPASQTPRHTRSSFDGGWKRAVRQRIAAQVPLVRHWRVELGSYLDLSDLDLEALRRVPNPTSAIFTGELFGAQTPDPRRLAVRPSPRPDRSSVADGPAGS